MSKECGNIESVGLIVLSNGMLAIVDVEDFERVSQFSWFASLDSRGTKWYAKRRARKTERERWKCKHIRLHHFVLDTPSNDLPEAHVVDHLDHNGLNCRKSNLEIVTQAVNMQRSQGWKKKFDLLPDF